MLVGAGLGAPTRAVQALPLEARSINTPEPSHGNAVASMASGTLVHCWTLHSSSDSGYMSACTECTGRTFTCVHILHDQVCRHSRHQSACIMQIRVCIATMPLCVYVNRSCLQGMT